MLDLGIDQLYSGIGITCVPKKEKECYSLDTPKECNDLKLSQNIFSDPLFDLTEFNSETLCDYSDILINNEENNPEYTFQHSHSDDSSILSFPEQRSPAGSLNDIELKYELQNNPMNFQGLENFVNYEVPGMNNYSRYSNYNKLPPIIFQPFLQAYNSLMSPPVEQCYNYPVLSNNSNLLNLPRDTIVYVPTPVRNLQSNVYFNNQPFNMSPDNNYSIESTTNYHTTSINTPLICHSEIANSMPILEIGGQPSNFIEKPVKPKKVAQTEKTFCCSTCEVKFTRRDELRRHEKIHSGEKPLSCPYCDKCFIRSDHRKTHIRTHTGEKPYACDICLKRFARSDEKLRHTKTHFRERPRRRRRKKINEQDFYNTMSIETSIPDQTVNYSDTTKEQTIFYNEDNLQQTYNTSNTEYNTEQSFSPLFLEQLWNN